MSFHLLAGFAGQNDWVRRPGGLLHSWSRTDTTDLRRAMRESARRTAVLVGRPTEAEARDRWLPRDPGAPRGHARVSGEGSGGTAGTVTHVVKIGGGAMVSEIGLRSDRGRFAAPCDARMAKAVG